MNMAIITSKCSIRRMKMPELDKPTVTLIEEAVNAGVDEDTTVGMIKAIRQEQINPQEVLDNLHKMTPPYIDADITKAMADTLRTHHRG
jgi:hypothetical protein